MTNKTERTAIAALPVIGDEEYMLRLISLTNEERKIVEEKIPVSFDRAEHIIMKVLDYQTVSDGEFMSYIKQLIDENKEAFKLLAEL